MGALIRSISALLFILLSGLSSKAQQKPAGSARKPTSVVTSLENGFHHPPASAGPWVFWYWMHAAVSKPGIHADLEAMKSAGIGGAYLMPIQGPTQPPLTDTPIGQLSPAWWDMVRYAMQQADGLGLKLAMHACDGFAVAGGPWITPGLSMQKILWTRTAIEGGHTIDLQLSRPEAYAHYYCDIAVFAFPEQASWTASTRTQIPMVSTNLPGPSPQFLAMPGNTESFKSDEPCWIQYAFDRPFTARQIVIHTQASNYQAQRLIIEVSDDGVQFRTIGRLEPPRHGWQDNDADDTHAIPAVTARYFRFVYDKTGSEPGAEDLDAAKWKPTLKLDGIELSGEPAIDGIEGKTGEVWRVGKRTTSRQLPDSLCISPDQIVTLSEKMDSSGRLVWDAPPGRWIVLRIGHGSTGHMNATGGAGKGLECDKFNSKAVAWQFDHWFGEAIRRVGPELAGRVLKIFHVDSWECGSQNWSSSLPETFRRRQGYDLLPWLPVLAGIPVKSADASERFLHDLRETLAAMLNDTFYGTMAKLAHAHGCQFSAESVAPTMISDGMLHFRTADIPMGEFWFRSPTHDKPNDILDAVSGAHIYGKPIVQAEAFTELRMAWDEHPGMCKALQDRNYALGINRLVFHVFTENPWMDRKPGMTLDGVGLYFQRDQTWWRPARAWIDYTRRCQFLLQQGRPVVDLAVFTGDEIPRRAVLPDRLVGTLPGIFGEERVEEETRRLANKGEPQVAMPPGVVHSANMTSPQDWIDPLHGYAWDSFNPDALLDLAQVKGHRVVLPGGASYGLLILPGAYPLSPDPEVISPAVANRLLDLAKRGANLLITVRALRSDRSYPAGADDTKAAGLNKAAKAGAGDSIVREAYRQLLDGKFTEMTDSLGGKYFVSAVGKGRVIRGAYRARSFNGLGIAPDLRATDETGQPVNGIAYTHRAAQGLDIYFVSNQLGWATSFNLSLRVSGREPELWDAVTGEIAPATVWNIRGGRTELPLRLAANGSIFIVFRYRAPSHRPASSAGAVSTLQILHGPWRLRFDSAAGGPRGIVRFDSLTDWSENADPSIRYYSGAVTYQQEFDWNGGVSAPARVWLELGRVADLASVQLNGKDCGVAWTAPYRVEIGSALRQGHNILSITVTNTWANRLTGDHGLPENQRITRTTAPYHLDGRLLDAGLLGPVSIIATPAIATPVIARMLAPVADRQPLTHRITGIHTVISEAPRLAHAK